MSKFCALKARIFSILNRSMCYHDFFRGLDTRVEMIAKLDCIYNIEELENEIEFEIVLLPVVYAHIERLIEEYKRNV